MEQVRNPSLLDPFSGQVATVCTRVQCTYILYDSRTIGTLGPRNARWYSLCVDHIPLPCLETLLFLRLFHLTHTYVPRGLCPFFYFRSPESTAPSAPSTIAAPCPFPPCPSYATPHFSVFFLSTPPTKLRINSGERFGTLANFPTDSRDPSTRILANSFWIIERRMDVTR